MLVQEGEEAIDSEPMDAFGNVNDRNVLRRKRNEDNDVIVLRVGIWFVDSCDDQLLVMSALDYELAFD